MFLSIFCLSIFVDLFLLCISFEFNQVGLKLAPTDVLGTTINFGASVAITPDGTTMVVGGYSDGANVGAAWVYTFDGTSWSEDTKLVGTGVVGNSLQGFQVAISEDGNTIASSGYGDGASPIGATWVFVKTLGVWSQQGSKLVGAGFIGAATPYIYQGYSIGLSANGNTLVVGGFGDSSNKGAVWYFFRSGGSWDAGTKILGSFGGGRFGHSVAISADGSTVAVGAPYANSLLGWLSVYTLSGSVFSKQGVSFTGTGNTGITLLGGSELSLSADGDTLVAGGYADGSDKGAVWVFRRNDGVWSQQVKLTASSEAIGNSFFGRSTGLSHDGNILAVGAHFDGSNVGAIYAFSFDGSAWTQNGNKVVGSGYNGSPEQGFSLDMSGDGSTVVFGGLHDIGGVNGVDRVGAVWTLASVPSPTASPTTPNMRYVVVRFRIRHMMQNDFKEHDGALAIAMKVHLSNVLNAHISRVYRFDMINERGRDIVRLRVYVKAPDTGFDKMGPADTYKYLMLKAILGGSFWEDFLTEVDKFGNRNVLVREGAGIVGNVASTLLL